MKDYNEITIFDGKELVQTARLIVTEYLTTKKISSDKEFESNYSFKSGIFVTLNDPNGLRGCIGFPLPEKKLFKALIDASIAAATEDPRFPPLKLEELEQITFEITILTPPKEVKIMDSNEVSKQIKVGRDGLIVKHSLSSGLLLPQVATEYNWNELEFLEYTCEKAGLSKDHWKNIDTTIYKFEGIIFKEEKPRGKVIKENLSE